MYRCKKCNAIVPKATQMRRIVKHRIVRIGETDRMRQEIESETPVCEECYQKNKETALAEGYGKKVS